MVFTYIEGGQVFIVIYLRFRIDFRHRALYYNFICLILLIKVSVYNDELFTMLFSMHVRIVACARTLYILLARLLLGKIDVYIKA